jgi:DNA polymerase-3 subunit gamma/tau
VPDYSDAGRSDWEAINEITGLIPLEDAQLYYQIAIKGREELGIAPDPRTGLEMTLLRMLAFRPVGDEGGLEDSKRISTQGSDPSQGSNSRGTRAASAAAAAARVAATLLSEADTRPSGEAQPTANSLEPRQADAPQAQTLTGAEMMELTWLDMAESLNITGPVRELARNLHLKQANNEQWDFEIDHGLRHLASRDYLERLRQAISEELGFQVKVLLSDSKDGVLHTLAAIEQSRMRTQLTEAERCINEDPTVRALKKNFGAQIIEDSIQPLQ